MAAPSAQRLVLVTGASSGIGRALAQAFAKAGDRVVACGRDRRRLEQLTDLLAATGFDCSSAAFDLRDERQIARATHGVRIADGRRTDDVQRRDAAAARHAERETRDRSLEPNQIVSGAPVMPHETWMKAQAVIPRLPELRQLVRSLEQRVATLENQLTQTPRASKKPSARARK